VACMADAPLIEHNVASRCNMRSGLHNVAIWVWECDDAVIQFNEAFGTRTAKDGQAFDIDGMCRRTIVQYNYSHDNEGGFILLCESGDPDPRRFNDGSIVRYNISQNDGARIFQVGGKVTNAEIYNNVIFVDRDQGDPLMIWHNKDGLWPDNIRYTNNIFVNHGTGGFDLGESTNNSFDSNLFHGHHDPTEPDDPHKLTDDPGLLAPGTGGTGLDTVDGYRLRADSPCLDSGLTMPDNGGRDFWGNPVPSGEATNRGAHELPQ
ncbi:MAG: right-handed parallel beta-helix repeat-containing protein, partial [Proteobacteria bacterium]|nr:right-handed parallel beta-helix repeat-containing protein [Pseudomonadota bacterium]